LSPLSRCPSTDYLPKKASADEVTRRVGAKRLGAMQDYIDPGEAGEGARRALLNMPRFDPHYVERQLNKFCIGVR